MGRLELTVKVHLLVGLNGAEPEAGSLDVLGFRLVHGDERHLAAKIPYRDKANLLEKLHAAGIRLDDIWFEEPDLEEVYFESY